MTRITFKGCPPFKIRHLKNFPRKFLIPKEERIIPPVIITLPGLGTFTYVYIAPNTIILTNGSTTLIGYPLRYPSGISVLSVFEFILPPPPTIQLRKKLLLQQTDDVFVSAPLGNWKILLVGKDEEAPISREVPPEPTPIDLSTIVFKINTAFFIDLTFDVITTFSFNVPDDEYIPMVFSLVYRPPDPPKLLIVRLRRATYTFMRREAGVEKIVYVSGLLEFSERDDTDRLIILTVEFKNFELRDDSTEDEFPPIQPLPGINFINYKVVYDVVIEQNIRSSIYMQMERHYPRPNNPNSAKYGILGGFFDQGRVYDIMIP